jgi:hypothetical protein
MRGESFMKRLILWSGILLVLAAVMPLYSLPHQRAATETVYSWQLAWDDSASALWLVSAFCWPWVALLIIGGSPGTLRRRIGITLAPLLAAWSVFIFLAVQAGAFTYEPIFPMIPLPWVVVAGKIGAGGILAFVANGVFLIGALWTSLVNARHWWSGRRRSSGPAVPSASL